MKPEIKAAWVAALRSGEYEQGRHRLHTKGQVKDTFCCLGVLCDLAVKAGLPVPVVQQEDSAEGAQVVAYDLCTEMPPSQVLRWAEGDSTALSVGTDSATLANLNDTGSTFAEIAEIIEEKF